MKKSFLTAISLLALSAFAAEQKTVTVQGQLHVQSQISLRNALIEGKTLSAAEGLDIQTVSRMTTSGFAAYVPTKSKVQIADCENAIIVVTADEGNFLPN